MQVNRVTAVQNRVNFKSNIFDSVESLSIGNNIKEEDSKKIILGLTGLAVIGAAVAASCILKNKHLPSTKIQTPEIQNRHPKKPKIDPIYKHLDGHRDKEALKIYRAYQARAKMASLQKRSMSGEFIGKSMAFEYANYNFEKLQRVAQGVI